MEFKSPFLHSPIVIEELSPKGWSHLCQVEPALKYVSLGISSNLFLCPGLQKAIDINNTVKSG